MKRFFCSWRETYKDLSIRRCRFPARARCGSMVLIKSAGLWGYCLERLTVAGERTGFAANTRRDPTHLTLTRRTLWWGRDRGEVELIARISNSGLPERTPQSLLIDEGFPSGPVLGCEPGGMEFSERTTELNAMHAAISATTTPVLAPMAHIAAAQRLGSGPCADLRESAT
jgi:hypothetical protein